MLLEPRIHILCPCRSISYTKMLVIVVLPRPKVSQRDTVIAVERQRDSTIFWKKSQETQGCDSPWRKISRFSYLSVVPSAAVVPAICCVSGRSNGPCKSQVASPQLHNKTRASVWLYITYIMSETLLFARGTIHQGDERFNSLSRGWQSCFMSLSALLFNRLCFPLSVTLFIDKINDM